MPVHLALYRECRPRGFKDIVGQEHVTRTLVNALAQERPAHAYLFCGPHGTGKTSTARALAKALNCPTPNGAHPCGECEVCQGIAAGEGVDVIEMDAASNRGIEEIRGLRERVRLAPVSGRYKVYVIDEVHMLTNEANNALLKTIEEPPAKVVFVLCTTEAYRIPATILSRCQRFDFRRLATAEIAGHLGEVAAARDWCFAPDALVAIARAAAGSMRDALGIMDQCVAYTAGAVAIRDVHNVLGAVDATALGELAEAVLAGNLPDAWRVVDQLLAQGRDAREIARALAAHFRDLLLWRLAGEDGEPVGPLADDAAVIARHAGMASEKQLYEGVDGFAALEAELRLAPQPRLLLEAKLVRFCGRDAPGAADNPPVKPKATAKATVTENAKAPSTAPDQPRPSPPKAKAEPGPGAGRGATDSPGPQPDAPPPFELGEPPPGPDDAPAESVEGPTAPKAAPPEPASRPATAKEAKPDQPVPPVPTPAKKGGTAGSIHPSPSVKDVKGPCTTEELSKAWREVLSELSPMESGCLQEAELGWEGKHLCAYLPEVTAAVIRNRDICGTLGQALSSILGQRVEVQVKARERQPSLFDAQDGAGMDKPGPTTNNAPDDQAAGAASPPPTAGRPGRSASKPAGAAPADQSQGRQDREDGDDLVKQAQEMFRAEEVGKGVDRT